MHILFLVVVAWMRINLAYSSYYLKRRAESKCDPFSGTEEGRFSASRPAARRPRRAQTMHFLFITARDFPPEMDEEVRKEKKKGVNVQTSSKTERERMSGPVGWVHGPIFVLHVLALAFLPQ